MTQSKDEDEAIGGDMFLQLHRLTERVSKRQGIPMDRAVDYLLAGSLFTAAHIYDLSIDETLEVVEEIAESIQEDELEGVTRH